jgi:poly(A) polymerase
MKGRRAMNLLEHRRFRAAYDFMMLRADIGGAPKAVADFWTDVQQLDVNERNKSFGVEGKPQGKKRRRRPRKRKAAAEN